MIEISKEESLYLREHFKGRFNPPHIRILNRKHNSRSKTYITEDRRDVLQLLEQFKNIRSKET